MKPKRQNKQKDVLFILISSFVVVVAWIAFNIYHIYVTSTVSETIQMQLAPISASFDHATIEQLKTRETIAPLYTAQLNASPAALITTPILPGAILPNTLTPASGSSQLSPTNSPINRQGQ